MLRYEIIRNEVELKRISDYYTGITIDADDTYPEVIAAYSSLDEALKELEAFGTYFTGSQAPYLVTEYYVQENIRDESGEWIEGGDVWKVALIEK